ncbi:MAG: NfeD family protein [Planctomycetota bacterium]
MSLWFVLSFGLALCALSARTAHAQPTDDQAMLAPDTIVIFPIGGEIDGSLAASVMQGVNTLVEEYGAKTFVFELSTDGGRIDSSIELANFLFALDERSVRTIAYVPSGQRALSGGTLLALACEHLVMGDNSLIGNVMPIGLSAFGDRQELGEKEQTFVREQLKTYARKRGYPLALVESMVTKTQVLELTNGTIDGQRFVTKAVYDHHLTTISDAARKGLGAIVRVPADQILTLDSKSAFSYGFASHLQNNVEAVANDFNLNGLVFRAEEVATILNRPDLGADPWLAMVVAFFSHSFVRFLLIVIGVLGVVLEFKIPGAFVPGAVGLVAFLLYFTAGYYQGTVNWIDVTMFVAAGALISIELFVLPGFGFIGLLGFAMLFASLVLALQMDQDFSLPRFFDDGFLVLSGLSLGLVAIFVVLHFLPDRSRFVQSAVLGSGQVVEADPNASDYQFLIGKTGTAASDLRPVGIATVQDREYSVSSDGAYIAVGTPIVVVKVEGNRVVVRTRTPPRAAELESPGISS